MVFCINNQERGEQSGSQCVCIYYIDNINGSPGIVCSKRILYSKGNQRGQNTGRALLYNPATGRKNHPDCPIPPHNEMQKQPCDPNPRKPESVGSFLKKLLPGDFDTSDLIIILLLLLMSGDCAEDQNRALLTMALYLFL